MELAIKDSIFATLCHGNYIIPYMTQFLHIKDIMNLKLTCKFMKYILQEVDTNLTHFLTKCIKNDDNISWDEVKNNYYFTTYIFGNIFHNVIFFAEIAVFLQNENLLRECILRNPNIFWCSYGGRSIEQCIATKWFEGFKILCDIYKTDHGDGFIHTDSLYRYVISNNGTIEMFKYAKDLDIKIKKNKISK